MRPLALAHQANCLKAPPRMLACIGSSGVGKTVYLGMLLDMISRRTEDLQVLARWAFSINLQQLTIAALARGEFPEKTPRTRPLELGALRGARARMPRALRLIMPDMAGEALLEEVEHPKTYQVVRSFLSKCQGAVVMIDAQRLAAGAADQDYFTMKLLTYLVQLVEDPKTGWRNRPLAIVFSKADQCDACFDDPAEYAARHAAGLERHCRERFKKHRFFAASVAGNCAFLEGYEGRSMIPLRVEPRGIIEPFQWLINMRRCAATAARRSMTTGTMRQRLPTVRPVSSPRSAGAGADLPSPSGARWCLRTKPSLRRSPPPAAKGTNWPPSAADSLRPSARTARLVPFARLAARTRRSQLQFHPLASGRHVLARSQTAGPEYSGRGRRIYTQIFVIDVPHWQACAWHPFRLWAWLRQSGVVGVHDPLPRELPRIELPETLPHALNPPENRSQETPSSETPGPSAPAQPAGVSFGEPLPLSLPGMSALAELLCAALDEQPIGLLASDDVEGPLSAFFACLPWEHRAAFSFATGLKQSPRRPFRIMRLPRDPIERRRWLRLNTHRVVTLASGTAPTTLQERSSGEPRAGHHPPGERGSETPARNSESGNSESGRRLNDDGQSAGWPKLLRVGRINRWQELARWADQPHDAGAEDWGLLADACRTALHLDQRRA